MEGGIQYEMAMVLQSVHASVSVMQSASQPVRCTSLPVHGGLALVVTSCQADWSDVDCKCFSICMWSNSVLNVSVTIPQSKCLCENENHVILLSTHSSTHVHNRHGTTHKHAIHTQSQMHLRAYTVCKTSQVVVCVSVCV